MILVCDVGGTHVRFAVKSTTGDLGKLYKSRADEHQSLEEAVLSYVEKNKYSPSQISGFFLAFSNRNGWNVNHEQLAEILPQARIVQVNDFEANAYGVHAITSNDVNLLRSGDSTVKISSGSSLCLLGPGTGLGLAYIMQAHNGSVCVQRTHGGHMIPAMFSAELSEMLDAVQKYKTTKTMPIYEDMAAGPGLYNIYQVLCERAGQDKQCVDANAVIQQAQTEKICHEALRLFHEMLGGFAGQAVSFGHSYKGLYLTGGIIDRIMQQGCFQTESFFRYFTNNPVPIVRDDLNATPVYWVKDEFISLKGLSILSEAYHD